MSKGIWLITFGFVLHASSRCIACPYCDSDIGREVRAGIFNGDFAINAGLTLLPFSFFILIVGLIHFGLPWRTTNKSGHEQEDGHPRLEED
jgi:hypothetical protein